MATKPEPDAEFSPDPAKAKDVLPFPTSIEPPKAFREYLDSRYER